MMETAYSVRSGTWSDGRNICLYHRLLSIILNGQVKELQSLRVHFILTKEMWRKGGLCEGKHSLLEVI